MVISENCCNFIVLKYKCLQTTIAMITKDKVTEIFCMADDFCKFFDAMMEKYTIQAPKKRKYHREGTLSKAENVPISDKFFVLLCVGIEVELLFVRHLKVTHFQRHTETSVPFSVQLSTIFH